MVQDKSLNFSKRVLIKKKPPIAYDHFLYISKNMIDPHLENDKKLKYDDIHLILKAYQFFEYEKRDNDKAEDTRKS